MDAQKKTVNSESWETVDVSSVPLFRWWKEMCVLLGITTTTKEETDEAKGVHF